MKKSLTQSGKIKKTTFLLSPNKCYLNVEMCLPQPVGRSE